MKNLLNIFLVFILVTQSAFALSLSGDNWKNPLRTKTWTPPSESDTLVGESTEQELTNKTLDGVYNTFLNLPLDEGLTTLDDGVAKIIDGKLESGKVDLSTDVEGQLPQVNGSNFLSTTQTATDSIPIDTNMLRVPHSQMTSIGGKTRNIETGNNNILKDPSFEGIGIQWDGIAGRSPSDPFEGLKAAIWPALGTGLIILTQTVDVTKLRGFDLEAHFFAKGEKGLNWCLVDDANSENNCTTVYLETGWKKFSRTIKIKPNATTLEFKITAGENGSTGDIDKAYLGLPEGFGVYVSDVKNSTSPVPCTFSTLAWQSFGTVTNNLECFRDGSVLRIIGSFVVGTTSAAENRIPLPTNYGTITTKSSPAVYHGGTWIRGLSFPDHGGVIIIPSISGNFFHLGSQLIFSSANTNPQVVPPVAVTNTGERVSVNASIPIKEWQNSSLDVAATQCQGGPLKCRNWFQISVDGACAITTTGSANNPPNHLNWITYTSGGTGVCNGTYNPALALKFKMRCFASPTDTITNSSTEYYTESETTTGHVLRKVEVNGINRGAKVVCFKSDEDVNPMGDQFTNLQNFYVDANEIQVGFDRIDNKPIYQRCHKVVSDISADNVTITTWPASLKPIGVTNNVTDINMWNILINASSISNNSIFYNASNGIVRTYINGGAILRSGTKFCMKYTR